MFYVHPENWGRFPKGLRFHQLEGVGQCLWTFCYFVFQIELWNICFFLLSTAETVANIAWENP